MTRLSWPIENIKRQYEVVVVGSGYGASIAASRLARVGRRVCVLERGREWQTGEYPDTLREAAAQMQVDAPGGRWGSTTGLYDFRVNDEIDVFLGCGLGGTSLVNAGVALRADDRVFDDDRWPSVFRDPNALTDGYERATAMLRPSPYPRASSLPKLDALEVSADHLSESGVSRCLRPAADQRPLRRGRAQPCRRLPATVHAVRRLRVGLQLRREEHADHELPAGREEPRCRDLHPDVGAATRTTGRWPLGRPLPAPGCGARDLRRADPVRDRGHRRPGCRRARLHRDPAALPGRGTPGLGRARNPLHRQRRRARDRLQQRPRDRGHRLRGSVGGSRRSPWGPASPASSTCGAAPGSRTGS